MKISALKYSSQGKFYDAIAAQLALEECQKRHPERDYDILVNARALMYCFTVVQVKRVAVDMPTEDELDLPPAPEPPLSYDSPAWDDYQFEVSRRQLLIDAAQRAAKTLLNQKMNP